MQLKDIHRRIVASPYKAWQIYFLALSGFAGAGLVFDIGFVIELLQFVEHLVTELEWLTVLGIQGVLTGLAAELLYDQGDGYAKSLSHLFGSKDRTLVVRVGVMTVVAGAVTHLVPSMLVRVTEYPVLQLTGALVTLGIVLVHMGSTDWNPSTEWPALLAGAILALVPGFA